MMLRTRTVAVLLASLGLLSAWADLPKDTKAPTSQSTGLRTRDEQGLTPVFFSETIFFEI